MRMIVAWGMAVWMLVMSGCAQMELPKYVGSPPAMDELEESAAMAIPASIGSIASTGSGGGRGGRGAATQPVGKSGTAEVITASVEPAAQRSIIYNAEMQMVVAEITTTQRTIQSMATAAGGYLQELDGNTIAVRVPAAKFEEMLTSIERLGEVTGRHVKANDVTEEMRDLQIRLDTSQATRKRLGELLAKSEKVEDTIKIEAELERVIQTIELIKGKLQYMQDQVAFSTIRTELNSPQPPMRSGGLAMPFSWMKALGDGAVAGISEPKPDADRFWKRNDRFVLPTGFVRYYERDYVTEAMSADEVVIRLRREENYDGGDLSFWSKMARRMVVENRAIAALREETVKVKDGSAGQVLIGVKDLGPRKMGYVLGIVTTSKYVYAFEAWGEKDKVNTAEAALVAAFKTLDVKHW
jgi:hypothetical protein